MVVVALGSVDLPRFAGLLSSCKRAQFGRLSYDSRDSLTLGQGLPRAQGTNPGGLEFPGRDDVSTQGVRLACQKQV